MSTRENLESKQKNTVRTFLLLLSLGSGLEELVRSFGGIQEVFAELALRTGPSCPTFGSAVGMSYIQDCVQSWSRRVSIRWWSADGAGIIPVVATAQFPTSLLVLGACMPQPPCGLVASACTSQARGWTLPGPAGVLPPHVRGESFCAVRGSLAV